MAQIRADEITSILRHEIENYERAIDVSEVGTIMSVGDGIARIHSLDKVMAMLSSGSGQAAPPAAVAKAAAPDKVAEPAK